ncbi:MAG: hypothetical protein QG583_707 [Patescibacteria group bacterium]|nr:hypothetical protein [Patescibacteria group bacterium]
MFVVIMKKIALIAILIIFLSLSILVTFSASSNQDTLGFIVGCTLTSIIVLAAIKIIIKD